jgi:hypothetical protein
MTSAKLVYQSNLNCSKREKYPVWSYCFINVIIVLNDFKIRAKMVAVQYNEKLRVAQRQTSNLAARFSPYG